MFDRIRVQSPTRTEVVPSHTEAPIEHGMIVPGNPYLFRLGISCSRGAKKGNGVLEVRVVTPRIYALTNTQPQLRRVGIASKSGNRVTRTSAVSTPTMGNNG